MSEFRVTLRPALATTDPVASDRITLEALAEGHVIHVLGKPGDDGVAARLAPFSDGTAHAVRAAGPGQWFIVGNGVKSYAELSALSEALKPGAFGVDQSQGRVRMLARGSMVERVLAKGTAVDLSLTAFPIGHSTTTLFGHIAAHVTRTGEDAFEIMVLRGFAESLWDDLASMCAEYL
ncbi:MULTISPECIES: sarcosine oxidase subunit gamma family protein [Rhizobium]|uniref:Sarcosine oxidase subunit gamma n=1 Tax=Rhizobium binae TaxID=1138190 RepID=A0ABV2ML50_9HYPH|nr:MULTISPECIES: sarcosine oxidase subunit gamma family protein [Rhizobium]NKL49621.1 sarcosine oxidase subunit gamma [Rhizobium leguminosarum bv. viciae]MBX4937036.1 sarcosine oxidase subunit gamma [Rhizobium binae]MBX4943686.1 sarcosine oxidase subunit gamma [Rhizobium binae]MBX4979130.1 sarcosine oxidase subunit gamma [Rhizobium binae]MBX4995867.1 sarcosine oxidase subunit gamma [Rhizobium binae]